METITRKNLLYKTGVEYGDFAINYVLECRLNGLAAPLSAAWNSSQYRQGLSIGLSDATPKQKEE